MKKRYCSSGFTMIVLLIASVLMIILSIYAYSKTMKRVQNSLKKEVPEMNIPTPTPQNYQQTLDSVKQKLNQDVEKEQQRINDAQNEIK
jgi:predicted PurR-regulated permease PerM